MGVDVSMVLVAEGGGDKGVDEPSDDADDAPASAFVVAVVECGWYSVTDSA